MLKSNLRIVIQSIFDVAQGIENICQKLDFFFHSEIGKWNKNQSNDCRKLLT